VFDGAQGSAIALARLHADRFEQAHRDTILRNDGKLLPSLKPEFIETTQDARRTVC